VDGNVAGGRKERFIKETSEGGIPVGRASIQFGCLTPGEAHRLRDIDKWVLTSF